MNQIILDTETTGLSVKEGHRIVEIGCLEIENLIPNSKKLNILKRLKKRPNFNKKLINKFKNIQLPLDYKKKKSHFIIKNNFTKKYVNENIKKILMEIL